MITPEIIKIAKKIELNVKGKVTEAFTGEYRSAFKGKGIEPSEVREYISGDSLNDVDWKSTAKAGKPYIKLYEETRELQTYLILDMSSSMEYGTRKQLKKDQAIKFCMVIALSTLNTNDKLGLIIFTDKVEKVIKANKGRKHVLSIIREITTFEDGMSKSTSIQEALDTINHIVKRHAVCFLITDEYKIHESSALKIASKKNDLVYVHISDPAEEVIPDIGLIEMQDKENHETLIVDSSNKTFRKEYSKHINQEKNNLYKELKKYNIDYLTLQTDSDIFKELSIFFRKRVQSFR